MKRLIRTFITTALLTMLLLLTQNTVHAQSADSLALANADTIHFSVNHAAGWKLYNSYASDYQLDSVQLELVVRHDNNIQWSEEQYIGRIKTTGYIPQAEQTLSYQVLSTIYAVRVSTDGRCYLRLVTGSAPVRDPVIIPLIVFYRK